MANKTKVTDAQVEAAKEIYEVARREADSEIAQLKEEVAASKDDGFSLGVIKANKAHRDYSNFLDAVVLYKTHKDKSYKKNGLTWEQFCEAAGYERKTADRIIADVAPVFDTFSDNCPVLAGVTLSDIRYLGKTKADILSGFDDEGNLVVGDEKIPGTAEDIVAYIRHQKELHQTLLEEKDANLRTRDRLLKDKEDVIRKQARDLSKYERDAERRGLTPEEDAFIKKMENLRTAFDGFYMLDVDPDRMEELFRDNSPTPRMRSVYLTTLDYMRKQILAAYDTATDRYGNPVMCPEEAWQPGMGAALSEEEVLKSKQGR